MTPLYDLDCSCNIGTKSKHLRIDKDGGKVSLDSFIKQFEDEEWFNIYLKEIERDFDIDKAINVAKRKTNITIPPHIEKIYKDFFGERFYELKSANKKNKEQQEKDSQEVEK